MPLLRSRLNANRLNANRAGFLWNPKLQPPTGRLYVLCPPLERKDYANALTALAQSPTPVTNNESMASAKGCQSQFAGRIILIHGPANAATPIPRGILH